MDNELMNRRFEIIKLLIQFGHTNTPTFIEDAKKIFDLIEMDNSKNYVYNEAFKKEMFNLLKNQKKL